MAPQSQPTRGAGVPTAVIIVLAVVAALVGLALLVARRMREAGVYVRLRTKSGPVVVFTVEGDDGEPVRVLNVGGMYQSATYLDESRAYDLVFEYTKLYDKMFEALPVRNALMIGGGGYSYPKHYIAEHPKARMDVVEIDPAITDLAWRHFFLDRLFAQFDLEESGRLGLICDDGRSYLERRAAEIAAHAGAPAGVPAGAPAPYDAVLVDAFSGKEPAVSLATVEAARAVKGCLAPGGLYMANVVSALEGPDARLLRAMARTLGQVFGHVWVVPCATDAFAELDNVMLVASDGAYELEGARCADRLGIGADDPVLTDGDDMSKLKG